MIQLIIGEKGSGKTQMMIDMINQSAKTTDGRVVCIEKAMSTTYGISHSVRVIDVDSFSIGSYDDLYGFVCGVIASDYDISDIYIDGVLKIGKHDLDGLAKMLERLEEPASDCTLTVSVSEKQENLDERFAKYPSIQHK